jgi:hypothetical protein
LKKLAVRYAAAFHAGAAAFLRQFDLRDAFVFGGLGAVAYGLAQMYPPAAWIVPGVACFWLGVRK